MRIAFFLYDREGEVGRVFSRKDWRCISWHPSHDPDDVVVVVEQSSGGEVLTVGGTFDEAAHVLSNYADMTETKVRSVHSLAAAGDKLLPMLGTYPHIITEGYTLVIPYKDTE